jgi:polysaccharide transporter, PST family
LNLFKTSYLTSISTFVRLLAGFFINKSIAIYAGPTGIALVGQIQNFNSLACTIAKGGISSGIVKYTSEFNNVNERKKIIFTSFIITIILSCVVGLCMFYMSKSLSFWVFGRNDYEYIFKIFSCTLLLFTLNSVILNTLNGLQEIVHLTIISIISSFITLCLTCMLVFLLALEGALISIVINQSIVFFVTLYYCYRKKWIIIENIFSQFSKKYMKKLLVFSLMSLTTAIVVPGTQFYVRDYITQNLSVNDAGIWQGMLYISNTYLMCISMIITVYYTPKLSSIKSLSSIKKEVYKGFIYIIPVVIILSFGVFFLKDLVVKILFTDDFQNIRILFEYNMYGNVLKISSFILSSIMLAKALTKIYIITEIIFSMNFILLNIYSIDKFGLIGSSYAYCFNYLIYLSFMLFYFYFYLCKKNRMLQSA